METKELNIASNVVKKTLTFETNCTLQVSLPDLEFPSYMSYTHTIISNRQHEHELN